MTAYRTVQGTTRARVTPEDQLVLLLVRGTLPATMREQVLASLATPLRWDVILERATVHEVYPLLYRNLRRLGFPGVPAQVCADLEALYKINAFRNAHLAEELAQVLQLLADAGIPTVPLKGVTLAASLYGDRTLRVCADIDILVPRPMVAQALHLLRVRGYTADFTEQFFADLLLANAIECALLREDRGVRYVLELHWGLLWGKRWDSGAVEDLWTEARPHVCFGVPAYALSPEWEFLFLATHAARHQWQGLKWLVDLHEVCCQRQIDWEQVRQKAEPLGWEELVRLTLSTCHTLFATPLPVQFPWQGLPPWLRLFPYAPAPWSWRDTFFPLHLLKRPADRLRYVLNVLLVPTLVDRQFLRLPFPFLPLYYPLHPLRLGCKWGWRFILAGLQRLRNARQGQR